MNFFICYDISDDKRRLRLSKLLERDGCKRVQKSVFVAPDFERGEMLRLKTKIEKLLNIQYIENTSPDDSVMYIPLDSDAVKDVVWQGNKIIWEDLWGKKSKFFL